MTPQTLRETAAWMLAEAAKLDGATTQPPAPPPPPQPPQPPAPPVSGGINWLAFGALPRLTVASRVGVTAAIAFELGGSAITRKLTLAEMSVGGDTPTYEAWITADPVNGPVIGGVAKWQYTGGSLNVTLPGGPFWATKAPAPGRYYFCIKQTGGADTTFYAQQN